MDFLIVMALSSLAFDFVAPSAPVAGVRVGVACSGARWALRDDVLVARFAEATSVAGVFTSNKVVAAPVLWCREALVRGRGGARALVVNAGCANAATGVRGDEDAAAMARVVADKVGCDAHAAFVASTGVVGDPMPMDALAPAFVRAAEDNATMDQAARAILTTDTRPKLFGATMARQDAAPITLQALAKGSGMMAPNMATLLAFAFTDAVIAPADLDAVLRKAVGPSLNAMLVDGDESTNDTALLFATGAAERALRDQELDVFAAMLEAVLVKVAQALARDGEGARKLVHVRVRGARTDAAARAIARAIAASALVKTAIAGGDANWGRIAAAAGGAGQDVDPRGFGVEVGGVVIARGGARVAGYDEAPVARHMAGEDVSLLFDAGVGGDGEAQMWTCDLTEGYIRINADYRS